jgi:phosphate transport system substrate-binding protein
VKGISLTIAVLIYNEGRRVEVFQDKSAGFAGLAGIAALLLAACGDSPVRLTGGGATFPLPIYSRWVSDYMMQTGIEIDYQSIGSVGGIRQISELTLDFGASDGPMSDKELGDARGGEILHIPTLLGAVAIAYNIPGFTDTLNFDAALIADIFMGKVTRWNDARIAALNPQSQLPGSEITVVHRSEGSGTTFAFTDYLTRTSPSWAQGVGHGKDVSWPVGVGGQGNEQVAGHITQIPGSIGYIESVYALQNRTIVGRVRNAAGNFVSPTQATITAAASEAVARLDENTDYRISIVDAPGENAYPITTFTWLLVYKKQIDARKGEVLKAFMTWAVTEGQAQVAELQYGALPEVMRAAVVRRIESIELPNNE